MKKDDFKLTKSQLELKEKITVFLNSDERLFLITGKPGVGKTTTIKYSLEHYLVKDIEMGNQGDHSSVVGICFAHQAKKVLQKHIPTCSTFAAAFGYKEVIKENGQKTFEYDNYSEAFKIGKANIPVFIHDEVSQYSQEMLDILLNETSIFSKIILIGDKAQLPPINENDQTDSDSPVFDLDIPEHCRHNLTERVRQTKNNPILQLSDVIRTEIFGSQNIPLVLKAISESKMHKGIGFSYLAYYDLLDHLGSQNDFDFNVIAYRRKTVDYFNQMIRAYLLDNPDNSLVKNDIIIMLDNYYKIAGKEVEYVLHNSDVFTIDKVEKCKERLIVGNKHHYVESYNALSIEEPKRPILVPTQYGQVIYDQILKEAYALAIKRVVTWKNYWDLRKHFCNISYGYAITAYKCQGSTYRDVYLDYQDILSTGPLTPKRKLQSIYTAMTRAQQNVYFLYNGQ